MLLKAITANVWEAHDKLKMPGGVILPLRMLVVRLGSGELLIWSAVRMDSALVAEINALGKVAFVFAPNLFHHLFVKDALSYFPDARLYGCPGFTEKRTDLPWAGVVSATENPWPDDFDAFALEGCPKMNEIVLLHRSSRSLFVCDLVFNIHQAENAMSTFLFKYVSQALGGLKASRLVGWLAVSDARAYARSVQRVLDADFDRVIVAHGEVVERDAKPQMREACASVVGVS